MLLLMVVQFLITKLLTSRLSWLEEAESTNFVPLVGQRQGMFKRSQDNLGDYGPIANENRHGQLQRKNFPLGLFHLAWKESSSMLRNGLKRVRLTTATMKRKPISRWHVPDHIRLILLPTMSSHAIMSTPTNLELLQQVQDYMGEYHGMKFFVACIELATILKCQLLTQRQQPGQLLSTNSGPHALLLIYATKGIPVSALLEVDCIRTALEAQGFRSTRTLLSGMQDRPSVAIPTTQWLLFQLDLPTGFEEFPDSWRDPQLFEALLMSWTHINLIKLEIRRAPQLTFQILGDAVSRRLQPYHEELTEDYLPGRAEQFWEHYHLLRGGNLGGAPPLVINQDQWKEAVIAAAHVHIVEYNEATEHDRTGHYLAGREPTYIYPEQDDNSSNALDLVLMEGGSDGASGTDESLED